MRLRRFRVTSFNRSTRPNRNRIRSKSEIETPFCAGLGRQPVVQRAFEDELDEALQVELVGGHAEDNSRLRLWRVPNRAGVADRAIESYLIDPKTPPPRDADRQRMVPFEHEAERSVAARQLLGANRREGRENPANRPEKRHTGFAADRTVLEMVGDRLVGRRAVGADRYGQPQHDDEGGRGDPYRNAAAAGVDRETRPHENGGGEKTDITCAIISSRLAKRLSS